MTISITRLADGATLSHSNQSFMIPTATVFGATFEKSFYPGPNGESVLLSSAVQAKTFTFSWISGDESGTDQTTILDFFSKGSWFSIDDTELGLNDFQFAVLAVNPDFSRPGITCQARWGMEPDEILVSLSHQEIPAGGNSAAVSVSFTNLEPVNSASVRLTITAEAVTAWNPLVGGVIEILGGNDESIGRVPFSFAKLSDRTGDPISWRGKRGIIDSDREVVEGEAIISPITWSPFVVEPGTTVTVTLGAFLNPFVSSLVPWTLDLEAVAIEGI